MSNTNTQHTPGPWTINLVNPHCIQIRAKKGDTEFECSTAILGGWDTTAQENEANARLISAAPELLAFITKLANCVPYSTPCREMEGKAYTGEMQVFDSWIELARSVAAKATR